MHCHSAYGRLEHKFWDSIFSFLYVGSEEWIQVIVVGGERFYLLGHLTSQESELCEKWLLLGQQKDKMGVKFLIPCCLSRGVPEKEEVPQDPS